MFIFADVRSFIKKLYYSEVDRFNVYTVNNGFYSFSPELRSRIQAVFFSDSSCMLIWFFLSRISMQRIQSAILF